MHRKLIAPLLCAGLVAGSALTAGSRQDPEPTPLQAAMGGMQEGQRALRRLVGDPDANREALLSTLHAMQRHALEAYGLPPAAPDGEDAGPWRVGYQRGVLAALDAMLETEMAVHMGDPEAVRAGYEKMGAAKKAGHDRFQTE